MSNTEFDSQEFLEDLRRENAEDLKARLLMRAEEILAEAGVSAERSREIDILIPDPSSPSGRQG